MTVGHWGKGGRGGGEEEERGGGGGRGLERGEEEREGGPAGPPLWACRALHSGPNRLIILGSSGPSSLGSSGPSSGPVRPAQHKASGLATSLKKNLKFGPAWPVDCQWAYRPGPNRAAGLT